MLMSRLKSLHPLRSLPHLLTSKSHNQPSFHRSFSLSHLLPSKSHNQPSFHPSFSLSHLSHNIHYYSLSHVPQNFHCNIPPFLDEIPPPANWGIVIVPENQAYVVERLGGWFQKILYSGIHFLIPVVDRIAYVHSLKEEVFLILDTCGITKDDARILIDSVIHVKIVDPLLASYHSGNHILEVANLSSGIMLRNLSKMNLNEILEEMDTLNENIMGTSPLPKVGAIIKTRAKAERRKLAQVLELEGEAIKKAKATIKFISLLSNSIKVSGGVKGTTQFLPSTAANSASKMAQAG